MNTAFLLTGGNSGNRLLNLEKAGILINERCGNIIKASSVYKTAPWGFTEQPDFYNQALQVNTELSPQQLMQNLLLIEEEMGRKRIIKMGPRNIDVDILLVNDFIINASTLIIPHPRLTERRFALTPLAEIAPELVHPVLHKTILQLLHECRDELPVYKISTEK